MNDNPLLNEIIGLVPSPEVATGGFIDNWQTAFLWIASGVVLFAVIALYFNVKRAAQGKHVNKGALPYIKWPLLIASAGFNIFFTYYVFFPAGQPIALFAAVVMGGVNLAEAYLVRLIIATWRHNMTLVFKMALLFTVPVFLYSLMAAGSSFSTMMMKNKDGLAASQLELQAAQDRIRRAEAQVKEAQIGAQQGDILNALYQTEVRNSQGTRVAFSDIKISCDSDGYYAQHYPELCDQYQYVKNGTATAASVAAANTQAIQTSASEKLAMATILKERPPEITPTLLGFGLGIAAVGFIVSLALESAIIGVGFFEELFIKPTPLPAIVNFVNKSLDWDANSITQKGLQVDIAPSPGVVNFSNTGSLASPFSSVGWPSHPPYDAHHAAERDAPPRATDDKVSGPAQRVSAHETPDTDAPSPAQVSTAVPTTEHTIDPEAIQARLLNANNTKVGELFPCVMCETETAKRTDTKRFCGKKCRDDFRRFVKR